MKFRKLQKASHFVYPKHTLSLVLITIIIFAALLDFSALQSMKREKNSRSVKFDNVPVDEEGVLKFVAVDTATGDQISMEDWIEIVLDPKIADLEIQKLVTILKVSKFVKVFFGMLAQSFPTSPEFLPLMIFSYILQHLELRMHHTRRIDSRLRVSRRRQCRQQTSNSWLSMTSICTTLPPHPDQYTLKNIFRLKLAVETRINLPLDASFKIWEAMQPWWHQWIGRPSRLHTSIQGAMGTWQIL